MAVKYPHLGKHEERIWDAYVEEFGLPDGRITYDTRLGEGAPVDPGWPEWMKAMVRVLSQKRVDVIAEARFSIIIFEIKRRAGLSCLGQLLGYEALMFKQKAGWKPVTLVAVCEEIEPDMLDTFDFYKVQVVVVDGSMGK